MKVLFLTNAPAPYRIDFFNLLGQQCDLTVWYEYVKDPSEDRDQKWIRNKARAFTEKFQFSFKDFRQYDIVIICGISTATEIRALLYLKRHRIPYCIEVDGGFAAAEEFALKKWIKSFLMKGAALYFSTGTVTDQYLMAYGAPRERIRHYPFSSVKDVDILPTADTDEEKARLKQELGLKGDKIVLCVGRFLYCKGFDTLIKAAPHLPRDTSVYIVGGLPTDEYIRLINENRITNVYFKEFMPSDILINYYRAADVFVFPTRNDVWGLVVNEAMALGLPVICSDRTVAGLTLVEPDETGEIFSVEDVDDLIRKTNRLLEAPALRRHIAAAGLRKIQEYTIEAMAKKHMQIFQDFCH